MDRLYFLRHGLADRSAWDGPDFERPLTPYGRERMQRSARFFEGLLLGLDRIVTSPLTRARQTAEIVASCLNIVDRMVVDDRLDTLFDLDRLHSILLDNINDSRLMLVGHEPSFSDVIGEVIGGGIVVCKKGALARIDLSRVDPPQGELVWLLQPKILAGNS